MPLSEDTMNARYVNLATFRKDGRKVATPVWAAAIGHDLVLFSAGDAGKVKRLRNSAQAELAPCDVRGKLLGEWEPAAATIMAQEEVDAAHRALQQKYGWQLAVLDFTSRLAGRVATRVYIRVSPAS